MVKAERKLNWQRRTGTRKKVEEVRKKLCDF